jgi:Tol biopolymer transport system component
VCTAAILVLALAATLAACGGSKESTGSLPAPTVAGTIAYAAAEGGSNGSGIYVVNSDGSGGKLLMGGPKDQRTPALSADGTKLAYGEGTGDEVNYTIWVADADGSHKKQLTKVLESSGSWPSWSPDGKHIAFVTFNQYSHGEETDGFSIAAMNADGSEVTNVTEPRKKGRDCLPSWASNDKVLFLHAGDVWEANIDGTGLTQLTKTGSVGGYALSPDGTSLAVFDEASNSVIVTPLKGTGASVTLVDQVRGYVSGPNITLRWTADGKSLLIGHCGFVFTDAYGKGSRLLIVNTDGSGLSQVPSVEDAMDAEWQPQ